MSTEPRPKLIGASEIAAVFNLHPFMQPLALAARLLGRLPETEENEAMRWGTILEPVVMTEYVKRTGRTVAPMERHRPHKEYPCLMASLDGAVIAPIEDTRNVQVKTIGGRNWEALAKWGAEGTDAVPDHVNLQVQLEMSVACLALTDVPLLIGGQEYRCYT